MINNPCSKQFDTITFVIYFIIVLSCFIMFIYLSEIIGLVSGPFTTHPQPTITRLQVQLPATAAEAETPDHEAWDVGDVGRKPPKSVQKRWQK
jgi:hypothetical protein